MPKKVAPNAVQFAAPNPTPGPTNDAKAQLQAQVATMMASRKAPEIFLAKAFTTPRVPYDANCARTLDVRRPYDLMAIMGRCKGNDALPLLPNPADGLPRMPAAASTGARSPLLLRAAGSM